MRLLSNDSFAIERALREPKDQPLQLASYTVATVPSAAGWPNGQIMVSDESGGAVPAFSDGVNWRRYTDRAIIS